MWLSLRGMVRSVVAVIVRENGPFAKLSSYGVKKNLDTSVTAPVKVVKHATVLRLTHDHLDDATMLNHPDALTRLRYVVHRLRAPGGCPWDMEQTHSR
jgi:uncharacterized protein YabN with tetrapyrrole methylase and pyrophosphatase domain